MGSMSEQDLRVHIDAADYLVRAEGDELVVRRQGDDEVRWLDQRVPLGELGGEALRALRDGDGGNPALTIAVAGIVSGAENRGG